MCLAPTPSSDPASPKHTWNFKDLSYSVIFLRKFLHGWTSRIVDDDLNE